MRFLIDENIPGSVAQFLIGRGHTVEYVVDVLGKGTPDEVIARLGDIKSAVVVTNDKDFKQLIRLVPDGQKRRFRNAGRLALDVKAPRQLARLNLMIEYIDLAMVRAERHGRRIIVDLTETTIRITES